MNKMNTKSSIGSNPHKQNKSFLELIGEIIRMFRKSKRLSQKDLANLIEGSIDASYIGRIERGQQNPSLKTIEKIITALDISWSKILHYVASYEEQPSALQDKNKLDLINRISAFSKNEVDLYNEIISFLEKHIQLLKEEHQAILPETTKKEKEMPSSKKVASRTGFERYKNATQQKDQDSENILKE